MAHGAETLTSYAARSVYGVWTPDAEATQQAFASEQTTTLKNSSNGMTQTSCASQAVLKNAGIARQTKTGRNPSSSIPSVWVLVWLTAFVSLGFLLLTLMLLSLHP